METNKTRVLSDTKLMTSTVMLCVISIILSVTPLGYIPLGILNVTIMHIPVIIAAIVLGRNSAMMVGFTFGMTSLIRSFLVPTPISFVFWNPIVSVLPRILIGVFAYYAYKMVKKSTGNKYLSYILSALVGSLTNTIFVLGSIYLLYAKQYMQASHITGNFLTYLGGIFVANSIPEAIFAAVVTLAICRALERYIKN
ncbi:ECF transporter S component [Criibacterium bergeronii]|nr:ECF transporter S component [Criibacterium bergeronii]